MTDPSQGTNLFNALEQGLVDAFGVADSLTRADQKIQQAIEGKNAIISASAQKVTDTLGQITAARTFLDGAEGDLKALQLTLSPPPIPAPANMGQGQP